MPMTVLIIDYHFIHDLLNVLVYWLHRTVHLWTIGRRVPMLDLELVEQSIDKLIVQISGVVRDE